MMLNFLSPRLRTTLAAAALAALSVGCGLHKARKAYDAGQYEVAARAYKEVLSRDPNNMKARIGYRFSAQKASEAYVEKARDFQRRGDEKRAVAELQTALRMDPTNAIALDALASLEAAKMVNTQEEQEDLEAIRDEADNKPLFELNPRSMEGINLNFSKKTNLKEIFNHLSQASGVSILLHNTANLDTVTIQADLRGLTFQRILDTLMLQSDLFYRVMAPNTIMVFKSNAQNKLQFEPKLQKTFFISNAEATEVKNTLQSICQDAKLFHDKRMNAIIMRGNATDIMTASRIVRTLDKAKPEVMVYVELLEVTETNLEQVGLLPVGPDSGIRGTDGLYRVGATTETLSNTGLNQNKGGVRITRSDLRFLLPSLALDALKSSGDAKLVASPNVRAASGEPAEIKIGEKISTTQSAIGGTGLPSSTGGLPGNLGNLGGLGMGAAQTQYSYEDVGVTIKVEPRVNLNGDITLKIESTVTTQIASSAQGRPDLGQRVVKTSTRLRDGETAIFGGLLKEEEQKQMQGIWGISDIPVIGKLLGNSKNRRAKTDVILTVRAVQLKRPDLTKEDFDTFDPERASSESGHFTPKKPKKAVAPKPVEEPVAPAKEDKPAPAATQAPAPAAQPAVQPPAPPQATVAAPPAPPAPPAPAASDEKPTAAPKPSDLVIFCSPTTSTASKGDRVQIAMLVSGGKDVTSGTLELRPEARLKLAQVTAGDYLTAEGGSVSHTVEPNGLVKLAFKRATAATDSGTLAMLEFEVVGTAGTAPIILGNGRYMIGTNPITGKVVNALVTVE